ncbi:MAG: hypothetical protein QM715_07245 [Nibricoccus sp.]
MKKLLPLLLVLSLAANAVLLFYKPGSSTQSKTTNTGNKNAVRRVSSASSKIPADLAAAFASGDEAALQAVGFSEDEAKGIVLSRLFTKLVAQLREFRAATPGDGQKYWQSGRSRFGGFTADQQAALNKLEREFRDAVMKAFGDEEDGFFFGNNRYRFLSPARRDEIRRIERDYEEMTAEVRRQQEGISLASDRAKMELLQKEKERDILAALTPEERELNELYNSSAANAVRNQYGDLLRNEGDFKKLYALQKAFEEQYPQRRDPGQRPNANIPGRAEAQKKLNEESLAILGEEAFAAYRKKNDSDLLALNALQSRLSLPAGTVEQVYAMRDTYAQQSQMINADTSLTSAQRNAQLTALATQAKNEAAAKLGQEGADAYAQRSAWIGLLNRGQAFSTDPKDGAGGDNLRSTVFPLNTSRAK